MKTIPNVSPLDGKTVTDSYLGAYLVCQLADFRSRISPQIFIGIHLACKELTDTVSQLFEPKSYVHQVQLLEKADEILLRINNSVNMAPDKQREFLLPLYEKRNLLFPGTGIWDKKIHRFLELLCNLEIEPWKTAGRIEHNTRGLRSQLGGILFSLYNKISRERGPDPLKFDPGIQTLLDTSVRQLLTYFNPDDFVKNPPRGDLAYYFNLIGSFEPSNILLESYLRSPFHKNAAELMFKKVSEVIATKPWPSDVISMADTMTEIEWEMNCSLIGVWCIAQEPLPFIFTKTDALRALKFIQEQYLPPNIPYVRPILNLLKMIVSPEQADDVLINDDRIIQLAHQVETL